MKFFYIRNAADGSIWSRNRWGSAFASPDLYKTKAAAQAQINRGKLATMQQYWPSENLPVIVEADLTPFP